MVAEGIEKFRKEPLACFAVDKMQRGPPVATAEGQTHVAIRAPYSGFINQRKWVVRSENQLIRVADACRAFVIPALFVGLKVNGIEASSVDIPANLIMSYKSKIHRMIVFYKFDAKIRVFENLFIGQHQTSLLKTIFAAINKKKRLMTAALGREWEMFIIVFVRTQ